MKCKKSRSYKTQIIYIPRNSNYPEATETVPSNGAEQTGKEKLNRPESSRL